MSESQFALLVVAALLVVSNVFWAFVSHGLINKLMSRNFFEYKEASVTTDRARAKVKNIDNFATDDMGSMSELV